MDIPERPTTETLETVCRNLAAKYSWNEIADKLVAEIAMTTAACQDKTHSMADLNCIFGGHLRGLRTLQELQDRNYYGYKIDYDTYDRQMNRVWSALRELAQALRGRDADESEQAKFAEAQLSARQASGEEPPELGDFPRLNGLAKGDSSERIDGYRKDLHLSPDEFLDLVEMLAHNQANPAEVPNPPAYIHTALRRKQSRELALWRRDFGQSPEQPDNEAANEFFEAPRMDLAGRATDTKRNAIRGVESAELAKIDLKRGITGLRLPPDPARVFEAMLNGLDLQSCNAAEFLGWNPARLSRVRRSLEPGRKWGDALRALRNRFAAYSPHQKPR